MSELSDQDNPPALSSYWPSSAEAQEIQALTGEDFSAQDEALSGYFVTRNMIRRSFACFKALCG